MDASPPDDSHATAMAPGPWRRLLCTAVALALTGCAPSVDPGHADALVAQLRDTLSPMPPDEFCATGIAGVDGRRDPSFVCPTAADGELRHRIYQAVNDMGRPGAAALGRAYAAPDVRLRRAAALALESLGGGYDPRYAVLDLEPARPALERGLTDPDDLVRAWSAQALGHLGGRAASAVPVLIRLLASEQAGDRIGACIGLQGIGPAAREAVPAISRVLLDADPDVRRFAQLAIATIDPR